jgi:hypothetical protein
MKNSQHDTNRDSVLAEPEVGETNDNWLKRNPIFLLLSAILLGLLALGAGMSVPGPNSNDSPCLSTPSTNGSGIGDILPNIALTVPSIGKTTVIKGATTKGGSGNGSSTKGGGSTGGTTTTGNGGTDSDGDNDGDGGSSTGSGSGAGAGDQDGQSGQEKSKGDDKAKGGNAGGNGSDKSNGSSKTNGDGSGKAQGDTHESAKSKGK